MGTGFNKNLITILNLKYAKKKAPLVNCAYIIIIV